MIQDPVLLVVDMQKDFCSPGYAFDTGDRDFSPFREAIANTAALLEAYRDSGRKPVFIRTLHGDDVDSTVWEERYSRSKHSRPCVSGTEGAGFVSGIDVQENDPVVTKHRLNPFYNTDLDATLADNDVSEIAIAGVLTDVCVEYTAQAAFNRDYRVSVLTDCTAAVDRERKERSLRKMERIAADVITADQFKNRI